MNPALVLLLRLRLHAFLRRLGRGLRTPKGFLLSAVGLLMFVPWMLSVAFSKGAMPPVPVDSLRRYGPLALLAYGLLTLMFSSGERLLYYTPAEVSFLFSGPFRQRDLLAYKLAAIWCTTAFSSLIFTFALPYLRSNWLAGFLGIYLALMFFQLIAIILNLSMSTAGAWARSAFRKAVLLLVLVIVVTAATSVGFKAAELTPAEMLARVENSPVFNVFLLPFRPFVEILIAPRLIPDALLHAAICLGLLAVETAAIFLLNATYLESIATSSEKIYRKIQQMRRGGAMNISGADRPSKRGRAKVNFPDFPFWGGVGPALWRQCLASVRDPYRLIVPFLMMLVPLGFLIMGKSKPGGVTQGLIFAAEGIVVYITVFLTPVTPFDFRGDLDRMETLKTLPLPSWALAIGQLVMPTVVLCLPNFVVLCVAAAVLGLASISTFLGLLMIFPAVFQIIALENMMFLLFPTRLAAGGTADFTVLGRQLLLMLGKLLLAAATFGVSALMGFLVWWLTGSALIPTLAVALFCMTVFSLGTVPFVAWAYDRYDVARDTPA